MFKIGLMTSTALTAITLVLSGAPAAAAETRTGMQVADWDANARFLCDYGGVLVSAWSNPVSLTWTHVAVPFTGHGQTVKSIEVKEKRGTSTVSSTFSAGIYSNSPSGFPGKLIAGGTGTISGRGTCARVKISIPRTTLKPKTKYWIEEQMSFKGSSSNFASNFSWEAGRYTKRKAYVQSHYFNGHSQSSGTTPWTKQSQGAFFRLR